MKIFPEKRRTLSWWIHKFKNLPYTMHCPHIELQDLNNSGEPLSGSGVIEIVDTLTFRYTLQVTNGDFSGAFRRMSRNQKNPYDLLTTTKLIATDYEGNEWNGGYTNPFIKKFCKRGWLLEGEIRGITTTIESDAVSQIPGVELAFDPDINIPLSESLTKTIKIGDKEVGGSSKGGRHVRKILGTEIEFVRDPFSDFLWVICPTSDELPHPHTENWLSEPLRILCSQLVYPRFVARNFGNGKAFISYRPSHKLKKYFFDNIDLFDEGENRETGFWNFYHRYLSYISKSLDTEGNHKFESNEITKFYEEIIQASKSSRMIYSLTLSSAIEGIIFEIYKGNEFVSEYDETDLISLKEYIRKWNGPQKLQDRILGNINYYRQKTVKKQLKSLLDERIIEQEHFEAWNSVRNKVMHGVLYNSDQYEITDNQISRLYDLVRKLISYLIKKY